MNGSVPEAIIPELELLIDQLTVKNTIFGQYHIMDAVNDNPSKYRIIKTLLDQYTCDRTKKQFITRIMAYSRARIYKNKGGNGTQTLWIIDR